MLKRTEWLQKVELNFREPPLQKAMGSEEEQWGRLLRPHNYLVVPSRTLVHRWRR
jgi:hypothetical protein